jgi:hypothetical protein
MWLGWIACDFGLLRNPAEAFEFIQHFLDVRFVRGLRVLCTPIVCREILARINSGILLKMYTFLE